MHRIIWSTLALIAALATVGTAGAIIINYSPQPLEARFEAQAVGDPHITPCPGLGATGVKVETDY